MQVTTRPSYWQKNNRSLVIREQLTSSVKADVLIVGAGISGALIWETARPYFYARQT